jgi:hypothetical protein
MSITKSIPELIIKLSKRPLVNPIELIDFYKGNDWIQYDFIYGYPIKSIWKNDYMQLYLHDWKKEEEIFYRNNYCTVHSKILTGKFLSKMTPVNNNEHSICFKKYLDKEESYTFHPFTNASLKSLQGSKTLQLIYYHS